MSSAPNGLLAIALLVAGVVACSDGTGTQQRPGPPALLEIVSGNEQHGPAGQELPDALVVQVTDERGRPLQGQLVNFRVTAGGGTVFAGSSITNARGIARERWTMGTSTADSQRVEVRAVDNTTGAPIVFATFRAVADPGPLARLEVDAPAAVIAAGRRVPADTTFSLSTAAFDRFGNAAPLGTLAWTVSDTSIAVVSAGGALTSKRGGVVVVSATAGSVTGTDTLTLVDHVPTVGISRPGTDTVIAAGSALALLVTAHDPDGGGVDSVVWHSSLQGRLGTGSSLTASLESGTHLVRAIAHDDEGTTAADTVFVRPAGANRALRFDGDDFAAVADHPLLDLYETWTIEVWVKPNEVRDSWQALVSKFRTSDDPFDHDTAGYLLALSGGKPMAMSFSPDGVTGQEGDPLSTGTYHHIAWVMHANQLATMYVDGEPLPQLTYLWPSRLHGSSVPLYLGATPTRDAATGEWIATYVLNGTMDEVRIWRTERTGAQVRAAMARRLTGREPGLIAYWTFDEGTGDPVDLSNGFVAQRGAGDSQPAYTTDAAPVQ